MKEYKLFNTDGKTFFDFRSDPTSRCEGFTLSFLDDGTVVMSGDYGVLSWQRNYNYEGNKEFNRDYGFTSKETGISYFAEKVCQFGIEQKIKVWNKEEAIKEVEYHIDKDDEEAVKNLADFKQDMKFTEDNEKHEFWKSINENFEDSELLSCGEVYSDEFKFRFEVLKSVSKQVLEAVKKEKK